MAINVTGRDSAIYDSTKQGYKAELPALDFTKIQAREQKRLADDLARKKELASLKNTGLYNYFDSDVKRDVEKLSEDVRNGALDVTSQEYLDRIYGISGKTATYKKATDEFSKIEEEVYKHPEKFVWNAPDGSIYEGIKGFNDVRAQLYQNSPDGLGVDEILSVINPISNLDTRKDFDTKAAAELGINLFKSKAEELGLQTETLGDGSTLVIKSGQILEKPQRDAVKAAWIGSLASQITQMYGIAQAEGTLPKVNGKVISEREFADNLAEQYIPTGTTKIDYKSQDSYRENEFKKAQTGKLNKELTKEIPNTTYGLKGADNNWQINEGMFRPYAPLFKEVDLKDYNQQTIPQPIETVLGDSDVKVAGAMYDTKNGDYVVYGVKPDPKSTTVTRDLFENVDYGNGMVVPSKVGTTVDYDKTKTIEFKEKVNRNDYISILMGDGYTKEEATRMADDIKNKPQQNKVNTTYTKEQEDLIEVNMKSNPEYSREEIINALGLNK